MIRVVTEGQLRLCGREGKKIERGRALQWPGAQKARRAF